MDKSTIAATLIAGFLSGGGLVTFLTRGKTNAETDKTIAGTYSKLLNDVKEELLEKINRMDKDHKEEIEKFKQVILQKDEIIDKQAIQIEDLQKRVGDIETEATKQL